MKKSKKKQMRVGVGDNNPKYMGSLYFQEIQHEMGMGVGGQSSQIYGFIRFHENVSSNWGGG